MADSIDSATRKSAPTTRLWLFIAVGIIVLAGIVGLVYLLMAGDEQPIRVRNGSMDFEIMEKSNAGAWIPSTTVSWEPVSNGDAWTPSKGRGSGKFYVTVTGLGAGDTCDDLAGGWQTVSISYSDGVKILFVPGSKTLVKGGDKADLKSVPGMPALLRHAPQNDGRITGVQVNGPGNRSCTFATKQPEIHVCSTVSDYCQ